MSAEAHTELWTPKAILVEPTIEAYEYELSDLWRPGQALARDNRPRLSAATAVHLTGLIGDEDLAQGVFLDKTPVFPQVTLVRAIRNFWNEVPEKQSDHEAIARECLNALEDPKYAGLVERYSAQINTTARLGALLRKAEHTLAPCVSDVLVGYGKVLSELGH